MAKGVSILPFLRYVAEDAAQGRPFLLKDAPVIMLGMGDAPLTPAKPSEPERCTTNERPTMKLPDVIQSATAAKIQAELKPIGEKVSRLRATLDAYEAAARADAERRVSNALLAALGETPVPADPVYETSLIEVRHALSQVAELVGMPLISLSDVKIVETPVEQPAPRPEPPPPTVAASPPTPEVPPAPEVPPPPPSSSHAVPPAQPSRPARPPRALNQEDIAHAKRLIAEIEALRSDVKNHHSTRLLPLIQAIVAEQRYLLDRLPEDNYLHEKLGHLISVMGGIRVEGGVDGFVRGLAWHHTGDWEHIAFKSRRKVQEYDQDVEASARPPERHGNGESKPKKAAPEPEKNTNGHQHKWPSLPHLRGLTKTILLAGGILIPEKLKSVHERWGLKVEWHEIDHDNPRASQTLLQRVRSGKVGAVVFLEGVMRHTTWKPTSEACNTAGIPWAMADKAGVASLQQAFDDLERQLSS